MARAHGSASVDYKGARASGAASVDFPDVIQSAKQLDLKLHKLLHDAGVANHPLTFGSSWQKRWVPDANFPAVPNNDSFNWDGHKRVKAKPNPPPRRYNQRKIPYVRTSSNDYHSMPRYGRKYKRGTRGISKRFNSSGSRFAMARIPRGISLGPVPPKMVRKLHLQYNRVLNGEAGEYVQMEILGNSLVNPIYEAERREGASAVGPASEQVYGKDEMAAFYEDYYITGSTVEFTLIPTSTVTNLTDTAKPKEYPVKAYLHAMEDDDTSHPVPTTPETFREIGAQQRLMPMNKVFKLRGSKSTSAALGDAAYSAIRTSLDDTAYPTRKWKWILHLEPFMSVGAGEPWEVAVQVDVYYTVHFCNRKELSQSTASAPA